jgi:hypothetical protein
LTMVILITIGGIINIFSLAWIKTCYNITYNCSAMLVNSIAILTKKTIFN